MLGLLERLEVLGLLEVLRLLEMLGLLEVLGSLEVLTEFNMKTAGQFHTHMHGPLSRVSLTLCDNVPSKWYYDQKIISFFSSDFESVFA